MISKIPKYIFGAISSIILLTLIVIVLLFIRLQQGPISITFLTPYFQEAIQLNPELELDVTVDDCILKWRSFDKGFDISLLGGKIKKNNNLIASIPEMFISFNVNKILERKLQVKSIEINAPIFTIERKKTGEFDIGIGGYKEEDEIIETLKQVQIKKILKKNITDLEEIKIFNAELIFVDKLLDKKLNSKNTNLVIKKNDSGIESVLVSTIKEKEKNIPIKISSFYDFETKVFDVGVNFSKFSTSLITPYFKKVEPLKKINFPLEGGLSFKANENGLIGNLSFNFFSVEEGDLDLRPFIEKSIFVNLIQASGEVDMSQNKVYFNDLYISSESAKFEANGSISDSDGGTIKLNGKIRDWSNNDLKRLWPQNILPPVRGWYLKSIKSGKINDGEVFIDISSNQLKRKELNNQSIVAKLNVSNVSLQYLQSFPHLNKARGFIQINPKKFLGALESGFVADVPISEGSIELNLNSSKKWIADIDFIGKGKNKEILNLLNNHPINVSEKFILNPNNITGKSTSRVVLNFPVRLDLTLEELNFAAISNLSNFGIKDLVNGVDLTNADMELKITKNKLTANGGGNLNNIPVKINWNQLLNSNEEVDVKIEGLVSSKNLESFNLEFLKMIDGEVLFNFNGKIVKNKISNAEVFLDLYKSKIDLDYFNYVKEYNKPATIKFNYRNSEKFSIFEKFEYNSNDIVIYGDAEINESLELVRLDVEKFISPLNDISFSIRKKRPKGYLVAVNGNNLYAENYVKKFLDSELKFNFPEIKLFIQVNKMQFTKNQFLTNSKTEIEYNGNQIESLKSTGKLNDEGHIIAKIITKNKKDKYFLIHTKNAGSIAKSTGFFEDAKGGTLLIYAKINENKNQPLFDGKMVLENIRLIKVPLLARILSLASLTGIIEVFSGEGILFVKGDIPFSYSDGNLLIDDARLYGPPLGMRLGGSFNNAEDKVDISGTIIPAYTINSILGQIPLLGSLLVGQKKEGVFAISYQIKGPKSEPFVGINPILSLSPGFIRDFFSVFKSGPAPPTLEELEIGGLPD
ncbi:MAG: hypothetical protein CMM18_03600 [Rhodospirillaceae bacterium]|nr:hypothetical protein [Rhodospirillaceae bacterium]